MLLTRWWRKLLHPQSKKPIVKRSSPRGQARKFKLELEPLEDRLAPAVDMLAFVLVPAAAPSGALFTVEVEAQDTPGHRDTSFTGPVTVAINTAVQVENGNHDISPTAHLGGTNPVSAINGLATLDSLTLDQWGNYTFLATSSGLTSATSTPDTVIT